MELLQDNNSLERGSRPYTVVEILREVFNEDFEKAIQLYMDSCPEGAAMAIGEKETKEFKLVRLCEPKVESSFSQPACTTAVVSRSWRSRGVAPPGAVKRSTLQRYLYEAGLGKKQMRRYAEGRETSSRRFCRPHRMELVQGDIKYGPKIKDKDGKLIKTYLSSLIDDHSR